MHQQEPNIGSQKDVNQGWCPFLGFAQDPASVASFPTDVNRCWRTGSPRAVADQHQEHYCLVPGHQACSVFLAEPVPAHTSSEPSPFRVKWIIIASMTALVIIISLFATGTIQSVLSGFAGLSGFLTHSSVAYGDLVPGGEDPPVGAFPAETASPQTSTPMRGDCPLPHDYFLYYLKPGDDLNLVASEYGLTVDQILSFNCLDDLELITPGMSLAIPKSLPTTPASTLAPASTSTLTPTRTAPSTPISTATKTITSTPFSMPTAPFIKEPKPPKDTQQPEPPGRP